MEPDQDIMISPHHLAGRVRSIGFTCSFCGECCQSGGDDSGLVMVTPREIRTIMSATGLGWEEVARPWPETMGFRNGAPVTLGWCLRHDGKSCQFLKGNRCRIYEVRPWICRTYPFVLDGEDLRVSVCKGLGGCMTEEQALVIATDLIARDAAEKEDADLVRRILDEIQHPVTRISVIDSEGVKPFYD